jgi:hypothetical protein
LPPVALFGMTCLLPFLFANSGVNGCLFSITYPFSFEYFFEYFPKRIMCPYRDLPRAVEW